MRILLCCFTIFFTSITNGAEPGLARSEQLAEIVSEVLESGGQVVSGEIENSAGINCHGYSCLNLGVTDSPSLIEHAEFTRLLKRHFHIVKRINAARVKSLARDTKLQPDDLIVFKAADAFDDRSYRIHSGIMIKHGGLLWIRSKIGKLVTVDLPASRVLKIYKHADQIEIWRRSGSDCNSNLVNSMNSGA